MVSSFQKQNTVIEVFFADNWPNRGHNWIPCHDDPADKATVEFVVTAPEHYQVVANGVQIEETSLGNGFKLTHWKEDTPDLN
jgi:aminopeptidase N